MGEVVSGTRSTAQDVERAWANRAGEPELGLLLARRFHWNPPERFIVSLGKERFLGSVRYDVAAGTLEKILRVLDECAPGVQRVFNEFGTWGTVVYAGAKGTRVNPDLLLMCLPESGGWAPREEAALAAHALGGVTAVLGLVGNYLAEQP